MASFPDLRSRARSAHAGYAALRRFRSPVLLAVSAALLLTAFLAVSELATLRGAKAHDASAYLTRELGSPLGSGSLVRQPALMRPAVGGKLEIRHAGLRITSGRDVLSLRFTGSAAWRTFANGVARPHAFGRETITFGTNRVEQSLLVNRHQGSKVWRWRLGANVHARLAPDGSVTFGDSSLAILPVAILDLNGRDVTPSGLRWSLGRRTLELHLDDTHLPAQYIIDPVALVGACNASTTPADLAGCSMHVVSSKTSFASSPLVRPSSLSTGDLMVAQITLRNNDATITAPTGWTAIGNLRTSGTTLEQRLYYKVVTASDAVGTTYSWSWSTASDAAGAILGYSGVDSVTPFEVTPSDNAGTGTTATATGLTTSLDGDMLVAFYASLDSVTVTQNSGQGLTQDYTGASNSQPSTRARITAAEGTQATAGATGSKTAAVSVSQPWVAHLVALTPTVAADGSGTMVASAGDSSASQSGRTITFTYTAATGGMVNGTVTLAVPSGWSAPSTVSNAAGYTTASAGSASTSGQTITVSGVTLNAGATLTITYGSKAGGGPGATATSSTGAQTWTTQQKSRSGGTLTSLAASPTITVYAADGAGTMSPSTSTVSASQAGRTLTFTYTAPAGGISNGSVNLTVPTGWSTPSTTATAAGYSTSSAGALTIAGSTITVSSLTLAAGNTFTITYGSTAGGGSGAAAPSSPGAQTWTTQEKSTAGGSLVNIASSPSITVYAADGGGTMSPSVTAVSATQTGRTITFTYTAPTGGIAGGSVTAVVPSGWSTPSTTATAAGYSTSSAGTLSVSSNTITVSSLTVAAGNTFTITYGSTAGGGSGATAPAATGAQQWTTQEKSTGTGSLTDIASHPSITVYAADGAGTLTADASAVPIASTGNTITFTYTAPAGGISGGVVTVAVPSGWSSPSTTSSAPGYSTASAGTLTVATNTITVSSLTLAAGNTLAIVYGSRAGGGPGATATSSAGVQTWQAQEKSTSGGSLSNLSSSPSITVLSADGSGTLSTPTSTVNTSSTGNTITFTYTAATGGLAGGSVTLAVPAGWSAPSTTGSAPGYTTASTGTVGVSGQTITVSGITLSGGSTLTIAYGSTSSGGSGATAPPTAAAQTWQAQEKSSSGGTLTNLATSPSLTVDDPTAPSAPNLSYGTFTNASASGNTVYIRQGTAGGFTVTGTSSDPESGIDHLTFPSGLGSGWSGGGQDSSSPYTGVYTFSGAATAPAGGQNVTATNGWTLTSTAASFTVVADTTAPSVTAPSVTAGYYTSLSVPVAKNGGSDGGSGVDNSTSVLQRDEVALTNGACGTFPGSWSTTVTLSGGNDTSVVSGKCYRYRELLADNVGNQGTSAASNVAKVDTTAPSTPTLAFGGLSGNAYYDGAGTLFIRPAAGGTFTVTASSSDAQSGIGGYTFGSLNSNGGANFGGTQTGDHVDYTFGGTTTAPTTARTVSAANGAGTSSADATYSIAADTTAPSVSAPTVTAAYYTSLSVPVTKNGGSDGGAGIDGTTSIVQRDDVTLSNGTCAGFTSSWSTVALVGGNDTSVANGHCYRYRELLSDRVGNQGTSAASNVAKVDTQGPSNSLTLSAVSPAGSALKAGSTIYYRGSVTGGGSFKLTNAVGDGESGAASSATAALGGTTAGWSHTPSTVSTPAGGPYDSNSFGWAQGTSSSPTEVVTAADAAGNTTAASTLTFTNDSSAPTGGALTVNGGATWSTTGSFSIGTRSDYAETQSPTASGLASSTLTRAAATLTNNACGTYGSPTTIVGTPAQSLPTGCYLYMLTGTDNVGNTASVTATVKVDTSDPSAPTFSFSNFTGTTSAVGNTVFFLPTSTGSFDISASSSDGESGIAGYTFPSAASFGAGWSVSGTGSTRTYSYTPGAATPATQNVTATSNAGRTNSASFDVEVSDSTPPTTTIQCNGAACQAGYYSSAPVSVTLSADDGPSGSGVKVIRYTIDGTDPSPVNGSDYLGPISISTTTPVKFRAYDNLGNEEAVGSRLIKVDATPPTGQTLALTGAGAPYYGSASVTFVSGNGSDAQSGLDLSSAAVTRETGNLTGDSCSSFSGDAGTFSSPDTAVSGGHCYRYSFTIADNAGNVSAPVTATAKVDTDNPTATLSDPGAALAGTVALAAVASDASTAVQQVVFQRSPAGATTWTTIATDTTAPYGASWDTTAVADGLYDLRAVATDTVGHTHADVVASRTVDNTAPNTTIDSGPANPSGDATPTFTFSSSEPGSTFECRLDGGSWQPCASPHTTSALGDGSQTFAVRASDAAGNTDATPATETWAVDLTAPDTTIDSTPSDPSGTATPTFTFSSSEPGSTFECRLDGGAWTPCTSPHMTPALGDGSHTFEARATDDVGNTDATPAAHTWTIDLTPPQTTIDSTPTDPSNDTTPTFAFSTSEPASTFECRVDAGSWAACTSPHTTAALGEGSHTFAVRATDGVGNTDPTPAVHTWTIDVTAPNTTIDAAPADPSNDTTPTFLFSATEAGSTFECRLDGGSWGTCTSPDTTSVLGAGGHTYEVRATDAAGNTDATPALHIWTVDLTAPTTSLDSTPADPSNDTTPTFTFSADEPGATFACRIDGGSWNSCTSPDTTSALPAGNHTFDVRATDAAGNTDPSAASFTWTIDLAAPDTTIGSTPSSPSNDTTPTFTFNSSEPGSTFTCRVDGGSWSPCTSPATTTALVEGTHTFDARATDAAGNTDATPAGFTWTIDLTAPTTTLDSGPADPSNDTTPVFAFSASEPASTFACRIDGGGWSPCTSPYTTAALGSGSHTFDVRATDAAGNTDATPASSTWTIDLTAPDTTIDSAPPALDSDATPTFTFSSSEGGSTFACRADGGTWTPCTSPHTTAALDDGSHTFDVRATDPAGNTDGTPASHTWSIDLGPPTVTITAPTAYVNGSDPSTYTVTASTPDGDVTHVDFYECSNASVGCSTGTWTQFDSDSSAPYTGSWPTPGVDGTRAIRAVAVDAALNSGSDVRTITIDRTAPSGITVSYPNGYVTGSFAVTTDNGPDADVDASSATLERRTGALAGDACSSYSGWSPATTPDSVSSGHCAVYRYRIADDAGNWTTVTSGSEVKSDTDAPTSAQDDPGATLRQTVTLTSTAGDTGGSGLAAVAFQRRPAGGGSWTTIATDTAAPYSTSFDTTGVADGLYDFRTVATDVAGNAEAAPVVVASRRVDNTAPSATMTSPGDPVRGTVSLTSTTSDGGSGLAAVTYELAPHGGSFNTQPASWDTTLGADGLYDLRVTATDAAGNSTSSSLVTTRVDNTPPALTFASPAAGATVSGTVALSASSSDASPATPAISFSYKLHSDPPSAYAPTAASWDTTSLPAGDGVYDLRARATDDAANTTTVENASIRVDNVPPAIAITAPAPAINGSLPSPTSFSATAADTGGSGVQQVQFFECSDQSHDCSTGVWSPLGTVAAPGPYTVSWNIPGSDGNHALAAVATDNAGHSSSAIRNVDVDRTAPETTIVAKPADPSNAGSSTFTFGSSEAGSTFECRVDGGSWTPCTSPDSLAGLTDNAHTFDVRATDAAGNTDASPDSWTWHRDTADPMGSLDDPGANIRQTVTLTSTESDPPASGYASGVSSVTYEYSADGTSWATIGTLSSAPFDSILWNTTGVADGVYQLRVVVHDVAGNSAASAAVASVRIDNTAPTTSEDDPGQYLRATKALSGSAADSGSGVDHVDFQRAPAGSGSWTTIATATTAPYGVSFDTTGVADGRYDFRTVAYDVAGNSAASAAVSSRLVDNTPPDATMNDPGAYLRGAVSLTSATSDPGGTDASGIASVAYEYSTNGGSSWSPTGSTFDSTSVADGNVQLHVVATDAAGNVTTSTPLTKLVDNTKPVTTDDAPGGWNAAAVTVHLAPSDAGSGVNVTEYSIDGSATYTAGTSVVIPAPADGSNDGAHTIAYFSVDNAGNIESVKSATVLIDATPPACPSCSAADYLRGNVTLSASPAADGSGIQSVTFEYSPAGGATWTAIGTDTSAPYTVDWDTTAVADGHYDLRILIADNAGNVTTTDLPDKVVDNTAPNVATVGAPTEGQVVTGTVSIAASAADATSPISSVQFVVRGSVLGTDTTAPFSLNWNTTGGPDGAATIQIVVTDMAGNTATSTVRNVTVDNVAPTPTLADPGQNLRGTVSLSASSDADTTQVDFERRPAGGGSWTTIASDSTLPWSTLLDTTTLADGDYDFRAVATDASGHTGTSPLRANVRVDNTAPTGSVTAPAAGATVGGQNVTLAASVADAGSGVASVSYELRATGSGSFTPIASSSSAPFGATWDATTVSTGSYDLRPIITDRAGNVFTGAAVTFNVDVTAPTITLTSPGAAIAGTVTLNATVTGSGATSVTFGATPAGGATWTSIGTDTAAPWSVAFDTTKLADGVYDLRATVTDNHGNTSADVVANVRIDNTAPLLVSSTPADGSTVSSASAIGLVANEAVTPVGVTLDGSATVAPVVSGTHVDYNTGVLAQGAHTLAGELQDAAGKRTAFRIHFTVGTTGAVEKNTGASSPTTVTSSDGWASVTMPAGAWTPSGSDWLVLRVAPAGAPSGLTNGFGAGPNALDVTAYWALSGVQVHEFSQPVEIVIHSTASSLVPATSENGTWRVLHRVPTAGTLPNAWRDGFWAASDGFHILTRHLSLWALLQDLQAPQAPSSIRGYLAPGGVTIRWLPGDDNSGTYDYVTLFSGSTEAGRYGPDYTAASVAGWARGDSRIFRLQETDLAGNQSGLSAPLVEVPSLLGLTPADAEEALAKAGLHLGSVTVGGAGTAGTITGPDGLVLAPQGAAIDVTVAPGGTSAGFAFKVVTAARFKPAARKRLAARVTVTRAARLTAQLVSPRRVQLYTWRANVRAGQTILRLRVPRQVRRPGIYTMRWTARAGGMTVTRTIRIRVVGKKLPVQRVEIVLAGVAARSADGKVGRNQTVVDGVEPTFDATANRNRDVRVLVLDVDEFGVSIVRDLHAVFPSVKIVALAAGPRTMAAALKSGATVVLPRTTPPATLAKVIQRLAKKR